VIFMADFLEETAREIRSRMEELRESVDEFHRLEAALHALEGVTNGDTSSGEKPRRRGRSSGGSGGRRGRPRGTGTRATEALTIVRDNPGVTIPEMAQKMGIQQNYLYRVLPGLEQDGQVKKEGRGWFPKDAA
jgi:hypothetical protein